MIKVALNSWREGLEKITLAKLQMDLLGKTLKESKSNVDLLLNNETVIIEIENLELATKFLKEVDKIGVVCELLLD